MVSVFVLGSHEALIFGPFPLRVMECLICSLNVTYSLSNLEISTCSPGWRDRIASISSLLTEGVLVCTFLNFIVSPNIQRKFCVLYFCMKGHE